MEIGLLTMMSGGKATFVLSLLVLRSMLNCVR